MNEAVEEACRRAGSQAALARALQVTAQTVQDWRDGDRAVPLERCVDIERSTGVRCEQLRADKAEFFAYLRNNRQPAEEGAHA